MTQPSSLPTLWAARDKTDGRLYPNRGVYGLVPFPFTRAEHRADLPMERRERFFGVIGERWYEPQDFANPDFYWDNPTQEECVAAMAPYRAYERQKKIDAVANVCMPVVAVLLLPVTLPLAVIARLVRWTYR